MSRQPEIALFTVVHSASQPYLESFLGSVAEQTHQDFELFIINDGLEETALRKSLCRLPVPSRVLSISSTIAKNRELGLKEVIRDGFRLVALADSDDVLHSRRMELAISGLQTRSALFHDITLIDEEGEILEKNRWSNRLSSGDLIDREFLVEKNCLGFGNVSFRTEILPDFWSLPQDLQVVDWYFFYRFLDCCAAFCVEGATMYRQHNASLIGAEIPNEYNLTRRLGQVERHYGSLMADFPSLSRELKRVRDFRNSVVNRPGYFSSVNSILSDPEWERALFWWEDIGLLMSQK